MPPLDAPVEPVVTRMDEALRLHQVGYWVVPQIGKRAIVAGWDRWRLGEDDLRDYLQDGHCNIAIVLSQTDPPLMDVECDSLQAEENLIRLCPSLPPTPTYKAKRGLHRLFLRPEGLPDRAKIECPRTGIEFRIGNKAALSTVPPSIHPDGPHYRWLSGLSLWQVDPAPLPEPLAALIGSWKPQYSTPEERNGDHSIPEGSRNDSLFRLGCRLVRAGMGPEVIATVLKAENAAHCLPPMEQAELDSICKGVEEQRMGQIAREMGPIPCSSYAELVRAWDGKQGGAMHWTEGLDYALRVSLAVCLSTEQRGDQQLFLMVIGRPGIAKSRIAFALLVSKHCYALDHLTGFHSGCKGEDGQDYSMLAWSNRKTWVTAEGATLLSNPKFAELMDQARKIFDGSSSAKFKNRLKEQKYEGLRTPWIIYGTPMLLGTNQTSLGDRFLRIIIDAPTEDDRQKILDLVARNAFTDVQHRCDGTPESIIGDKLRIAYQKTGGFVDCLRERSGEYLAGLDYSNVDEIIPTFTVWAEFAAMMRSRPKRKIRGEDPTDAEESEELPSRLAYQFGRLASCLAAVEGKKMVDEPIIRTIRQVALDVAYGQTREIAFQLWKAGQPGDSGDSLESDLKETHHRVKKLLDFLRKTGCVELVPDAESNHRAGTFYRLTKRARELCDRIFEVDSMGNMR